MKEVNNHFLQFTRDGTHFTAENITLGQDIDTKTVENEVSHLFAENEITTEIYGIT